MIMKQKTIKTDKATVLVVELLPKIKPETIRFVDGTMFYYDHIGRDGISVPKGNWQLIGRMPDITEEQASKIVDRESKPTYTYEMEYPEYVCDEWWYRDYQCTDEDYMFSNYTAVESLYSFLQANEVYFDAGNTYIPHELGSMSATEHLEMTLDVLDRRSKVWDKERTYLFIKVD